MPDSTDRVTGIVQEQLAHRRQKLRAAAGAANRASIEALLGEVDAAIERLAHGSYGLCDTCREPIETDRLLADPLTRVCLDHLSSSERRALEQDLELAVRIQTGLLPAQDGRFGPWRTAYRYHPARAVSGDYCDILPGPDGGLHFLLGDVSGKGIAASMVMAQLHAMFRTLMPLGLPLAEVVERGSRLLCESTLPTQYATLVCGTAKPTGEIAICNAGHPAALLVRDGEVDRLESTSLPIGMFCNQTFTLLQESVAPGETILLYTDGVTEMMDVEGAEYGLDRLLDLVARHRRNPLDTLLDACLADLAAHRGHASAHDDVTLMAIHRAG